MTFQLRMKVFYFNFVIEVNFQPKDFLTSFINCYLNIKCSILQFEMYINSLNVECKI